MITKLFEIRDKVMFIPILAIKLAPENEQESWLLARAGYRADVGNKVLMCQINGGEGKCSSDPYFWGGRTYPTAHLYIIEHWDVLRSGAVIDVEFILGDATQAKTSERFL